MNNPYLLKTICLALTLATIQNINSQIYNTENPEVVFALKNYEQGHPAYIRAFNPKTQEQLWQKNMGEATTLKIQPSPNGKILAVLVGDKKKGISLPADSNSQNTLYILNAKTGKIIKKETPLAYSQYKWAEKAWQDLTIEFSPNQIILKGTIFTNPSHPTPIKWKWETPIPQI